MKLPFRAATFVHRVLLAGLVLAGLPARAVTVEEIPSPRPAGWTVDLTGTLPPGSVAELNRLADGVKAKTGAELAVVVVGTTGRVEPREFATRLFNHWGIGERDKDNGLLVFAALDDRAAEIILGDGIDSDAQVRASEEIMQGVMVPRFREGDPAGAILQGATACAARILDASPAAAADPRGPKPSPLSAEAPAPAKPLKAEPPVVSPAPSPQPRPSLGEMVLGCFLLLVMGFSVIGGLAGVVWLIVRPKRCPRCRTKMVLLSEAEDDAHLQPSERTEEKIGSVDYKIWLCPSCGEVKKSRRGGWSSYSPCPSCSARTLQAVSRTIQAADYDNGGLVQVDESCAHCAHRRSYTYVTPVLARPRPTRSYSSPRPSFFSSSRSSSSSSSSSSGSGFGGGRSSSSGGSGFGGGRSSGSSGSSSGGGKSSGKGSSGRW
ncbi:MAG TPA: TPM domain-containing protein [Thermoanaerobaculia bacterium]|nr:TPM domain-containing protein [Thermoanaerobaculia bacterium]